MSINRLEQISDILYYEALDIPLPELQDIKALKVAFHHATKDKVVIHYITLPKQSTVADLFIDLKGKVELSHPDAEFRLFEVREHNFLKIFQSSDKIADVRALWFKGILCVDEESCYDMRRDVNVKMEHSYNAVERPYATNQCMSMVAAYANQVFSQEFGNRKKLFEGVINDVVKDYGVPENSLILNYGIYDYLFWDI